MGNQNEAVKANQIDPGEGFKWAKGPNDMDVLERLPLQPGKGEKVPPPFRIKNTDAHPRSFWPGSGSVVLPGQVVEVPAEHRLQLLKDIATHKLDRGGVNDLTGDKYEPALEITQDPAISTKDFVKLEEEREERRSLVG